MNCRLSIHFLSKNRQKERQSAVHFCLRDAKRSEKRVRKSGMIQDHAAF